jgi:hypothetical protein
MQIKGYHISGKQLANSNGIVTTNILDFLLKDTKGCIGVFYHLDYSVAQLLRNMQVSELKLRELFENNEVYISPWFIKYMPKKFFNITYDPNYTIATGVNYKAPYTNISDMYQWHHVSDLTELDIVEYAKLAKDIGEEVYSTLLDIGLNPKSLVSPVNIYSKEILSTMDLPTVLDLPEGVGEYAYNCLQGSWVEAFKKGHFEKTYDYDLKGAYSKQLAELLDTRAGKWIEQAEYIDEAYYGYCKCWVNIDKEFSPIQHSIGEENYTPTGPREKFLTKEMIDFIEEYNLGTCEILNGRWWVPVGGELIYPLEEMIIDLNSKKEKAKSKLARQVIKRIPNGIWGKLIEQRKDNDCYNYFPPWATEAETKTTLEDARFVLDNDLYPDSLLHIVVDSVLCTDKVNIKESNELGSWRLSHEGAAFVIGSGVCAIDNKNGDGDFTLRYDWLMNEITQRPNSELYEMKKLRPVALMEAVKTNKFDRLGLHTVVKKEINVTYELKRNYPEVPGNGKELLENVYNSLPWDISNIENLPGVIDNDNEIKQEDY